MKDSAIGEESAHEHSVRNIINIPVQEIVTRIAKGGLICNENGLIYALKVVSKADIKLVSVGYEY